MVKFDVNVLRFLDKGHFRVLCSVEMGMKNHELVPTTIFTKKKTRQQRRNKIQNKTMKANSNIIWANIYTNQTSKKKKNQTQLTIQTSQKVPTQAFQNNPTTTQKKVKKKSIHKQKKKGNTKYLQQLKHALNNN